MTTNPVLSLLQTAHDDGALGHASMMALQIPDTGRQIQDALGVAVDGVEAEEILLLSVLMDDSGSMDAPSRDPKAAAGETNVAAARDGHRELLEALRESKLKKAGVLVCTRLLSGAVVDPFVELTSAKVLDDRNYRADFGSTPLLDQMAVTLGAVVAKTADFAQSGVPCRSVTVIVTDGGDNASRSQNRGTVRALVEDMLRGENHIILFIGLADGYTDFRRLAGELGIPDRWVLTPKNSRSEFRAAMKAASQSAVRASQGATGFSKAASTGFAS